MAGALLVETDRRGVATVTFNRPEVHNAFDGALLDAFDAALARLGADPNVRVLVLRGAGRSFSAGADLRSAGTGPGREPMEVLSRLDRLAKPTIALVQGACIGGGLAWAAACDVVIAEESASFSIPEVRLGMCPAPMIPLFVAALGARALRRYGLTGERFGAAEALRLGLVHEVCPAGGLDAAAAAAIDAALHSAPVAMAETKRIVAACAAGSEESAPERLAALFAVARASPELAEGRASFREKRKPAWYRG